MVIVILTADAKQVIAIKDSRQATSIVKHLNAAERYLETGESSQLARLGKVGVLKFEPTYTRVA